MHVRCRRQWTCVQGWAWRGGVGHSIAAKQASKEMERGRRSTRQKRGDGQLLSWRTGPARTSRAAAPQQGSAAHCRAPCRIKCSLLCALTAVAVAAAAARAPILLQNAHEEGRDVADGGGVIPCQLVQSARSIALRQALRAGRGGGGASCIEFCGAGRLTRHVRARAVWPGSRPKGPESHRRSRAPPPPRPVAPRPHPAYLQRPHHLLVKVLLPDQPPAGRHYARDARLRQPQQRGRKLSEFKVAVPG